MIPSSVALKMAIVPKQNQATRLAYLRETMGFTVRQVADVVGRSASRVTSWEADQNIKIKVDVLEKLAKLYNVTPEFIKYGETGSPSAQRELELAVAAVREPGVNYGREQSSAEVIGLLAEMEYIELPFIGPAAYGSFSVNCQDLKKEDFEGYPVLKIPGVDYRKAFVLEIRGNSMAPRYPERSRHIVRPVSDGNWQYAQGVHAIALSTLR